MTVTISELLRFAVEQGASDLHLSAGERPALRIDGDIEPIDLPALGREEAHRLVFDLMNDLQRRIFQERLEVDFAFVLDDELRFRVNAFTQNRGEAMVLRSIPYQVPSMEQLGLPAVLRRMCDEQRGLVLVTGPTGSGKSTTLAAMIDYLNQSTASHILTLEDPIEFVHASKRALVNQREIGSQTHSFANALRSALREDPDVILVGELRDLETISLALTAAETGHLVFGTLHTSSAPKTIDRVIDVFPADQQSQVRAMLAEALLGVVAQALLRRRSGGRVAALEVLVGTPAVHNLIREGKSYQIPSVIQVGGKSGMQSMEAALIKLVRDGIVELDVARAQMPSSDALAALSQRTPLEVLR